jgi:hypothetical protein
MGKEHKCGLTLRCKPQSNNYAPSTESFAKKLARATKALTAARSNSRKAHAEQAERERNRYRPLQRRERTIGM